MANWLMDYLSGNDPATVAARYQRGLTQGLSDPGGRNIAAGMGRPYVPPARPYGGPSDPGAFSQMDAPDPVGPPQAPPDSPDRPPAPTQPSPGPSAGSDLWSRLGIAQPPSGPAPDPYSAPPSPVDRAQVATQAGIPAPAPAAPSTAQGRPDVFSDDNLNNTIAQRESGASWNTGKGNKYSFMPSTWEDFIKSPANTQGYSAADVNNPQAQEAAMGWHSQKTRDAVQTAMGRPATNEEIAQGHLLGPGALTAFLKDPNGDAFSTYAKLSSEGQAVSAFTNNGEILKKGMTNAEALASVSKFYQGAAPGQSSGQSSGTPSVPADQHDNQRALLDQATARALAFDPSQAVGNMTPMNTWANRMGALSAGFGSGKNIGESFGNASKGLLDLQSSDNSNTIAKAKAVSDMNSAQANRLIGISNSVNGMNNTDARNRATDVRGQVAQAQLELHRDQFGLAQQRLAQHDPLAVAAEKSSVASVGQMEDQANEAAQGLQERANVRAQIQANPNVIGPDVMSRLKRSMATALGIDVGVSPDEATLNAKLQQALANQSIRTQLKGFGRITNFEAGLGQKGSFGSNLSPGAAQALLDDLDTIGNRQIAVRNQWHSLDPKTQQAIMRDPSGGFKGWSTTQNLAQMGNPGVPGTQGTPTILPTRGQPPVAVDPATKQPLKSFQAPSGGSYTLN